jgi:tetratricopeptide (TPR) repeat protein
LRHGARQIRSQFATRPKLKASLLADLGMASTTNACWDEAESLLLEAIELRRKLYGERRRTVGESLHDLGCFYYMVEDYDRVVRTSRESLDMLRGLLGDAHLTVARRKLLLAWCLYEGFGRSRARDFEAERLLREALATREALLDPNNRTIPFTKFTLTVVLLRLGKTLEAVRVAAEAAKQFEESEDDKRPGRLLTLFQQAEVAERLADRKNAVRLFQEALEVSRRMFGDNHPTVNYLRERVASALEKAGDFESSEFVYKDAVAKTLILSGGRPTSTYRLQEYPLFLDRHGRIEESKTVLVEVLSARRRLTATTAPSSP